MTRPSVDLSLELLRVVEAAAIASAQTMGRGDRDGADQAAVEAMRTTLDSAPIKGTIVIGEGERDEAPMLYIGEPVGAGAHGDAHLAEVDIAVDPLEGTNLCATGAPGAIAVLAASTKGGLLHAPDLYMEKLVVGARARHTVSLYRPVKQNLMAIARALDRRVEDLVVIVLDRPRHEKLIDEVRRTRARIKLIKDGDVSAAIASCGPDRSVDVLMGIGGAKEGVIAAAALRCMGGEIQARLRPRSEQEAERARAMGVEDLDAKLTMEDLAAGDVMFAATGVTSGEFLQGVRFRAQAAVTQSVVMRSRSGTIRFIRAEHCLQHKQL